MFRPPECFLYRSRRQPLLYIIWYPRFLDEGQPLHLLNTATTTSIAASFYPERIPEGRGIQTPTPGDFYLQIRVSAPTNNDPTAIAAAQALEAYYEGNVRQALTEAL